MATKKQIEAPRDYSLAFMKRFAKMPDAEQRGVLVAMQTTYMAIAEARAAGVVPVGESQLSLIDVEVPDEPAEPAA